MACGGRRFGAEPDALDIARNGLRTVTSVPRVLTSDDIDELGADALGADDPRPHVRELVSAVDEDRTPDRGDARYALSLAAELVERVGDLDEALALWTRALGYADAPWVRASRARCLVRLGRTEEGMGELRMLRPLLTRDEAAAFYVTETLEALDRTELAEQWLSAALATANERSEGLQPRSDAAVAAATLVSTLAQVRYRVRRDLELPLDEDDAAVERLRAGLDDEDPLEGPFDDDLLEDDDLDDEVLALFWPRPEFDELLRRWPSVARTYGATWDEHRAATEYLLRTMSAGGQPAALVAGSVADLVEASDAAGLSPADPEVHDMYGGVHDLPWPPGRNGPCWCGSGSKYKKCCLPRGRAATLTDVGAEEGPQP